MSNKKGLKKPKLKKRKFRISSLLGQLFWPIIFIVTFVFDLIFLSKFKFDFQNIFRLAILVLINWPVLIALIKYFYCLFKVIDHSWKVRQYKNASQSRGGGPGCGKSSSMYNDGIIMAEMAWRMICYEHFLLKQHIWQPKENHSEEWDRKAIEECYNFFKEHKEFIPCLWSKDTVYDKYGRKSQKLTLDHLQSKRKLLYRGVLLYDEIGKDLPAMLKFIDDQNKDVDLKEVSTFMRYLRHYGEYKIIFTEQDVTNMFKDNRRVTDENLLFSTQTAILRPEILNLIQYFHRWFIAKIEEKTPGWMSKSLAVLIGRYFKAYDNFLSYVGFRQYKYHTIGNVDKSLVKEKQGTFILMPHLNCRYDSRANKYKYKCANNDYWIDNADLNLQTEFDNITSAEFVTEIK